MIMIRYTDLKIECSVTIRQFSSDRVTDVLEWTLSNSISQYPQLLQNVSVSVVPDLVVEMLLIGRTSVRLTLLYNAWEHNSTCYM